MRGYLVALVLLLAIFGSIGSYLYRQFSSLSAMDFSPPPVTVAAAIAEAATWRTMLAKRNRTDFYKLLARHDLNPDSFKTR